MFPHSLSGFSLLLIRWTVNYWIPSDAGNLYFSVLFLWNFFPSSSIVSVWQYIAWFHSLNFLFDQFAKRDTLTTAAAALVFLRQYWLESLSISTFFFCIYLFIYSYFVCGWIYRFKNIITHMNQNGTLAEFLTTWTVFLKKLTTTMTTMTTAVVVKATMP